MRTLKSIMEAQRLQTTHATVSNLFNLGRTSNSVVIGGIDCGWIGTNADFELERMVKDLAPDIYRQRLLIERIYEIDVRIETIHQFFGAIPRAVA